MYKRQVQYRSSVEPAYLVNHPDYVQHVLQTNGQNYNKNTYLNKYIVESLTGQGLLTSENPLWREQRRLIQPAFHRRSLPAFAGLMTDATCRTIDRLRAVPPGETVDIAREMMRLTLDIVTSALFGYDITGRADEVGAAMDTMVSIGKPRHRKVKEAIDLVDRIVYDIIEDVYKRQGSNLLHPPDRGRKVSFFIRCSWVVGRWSDQRPTTTYFKKLRNTVCKIPPLR